MRRLGPPSEIRRLAAPLAHLLDEVWQRMHWWVTAMGVLYLLSGITIVRSDEVAVILRWGRLVGDTPALQEHRSGLLFSFPRPVDQVIRVPVKHVWEVPVSTLAPSEDEQINGASGTTLNSLTQGYAVTGDHNIVQLDMVARYRIRDPGEWAFYGPKSEDVLRVEVTSAMIRSLGEMGVDSVLSNGRKALVATATARVQAGLDAAHSGLELTSLELTRLTPPLALAYEFSAVQSAYIGAETKKKEAQAFAESTIPQANAQADAAVQAAHADAASQLAQAQGEAEAFKALDKEYRASPVVVRERLYRDGVEKALVASLVRWVPPPVDGNYHGFRLIIPSTGGAGPAPLVNPDTGSPPRARR